MGHFMQKSKGTPGPLRPCPTTTLVLPEEILPRPIILFTQFFLTGAGMSLPLLGIG